MAFLLLAGCGETSASSLLSIFCLFRSDIFDCARVSSLTAHSHWWPSSTAAVDRGCKPTGTARRGWVGGSWIAGSKQSSCNFGLWGLLWSTEIWTLTLSNTDTTAVVLRSCWWASSYCKEISGFTFPGVCDVNTMPSIPYLYRLRLPKKLHLTLEQEQESRLP